MLWSATFHAFLSLLYDWILNNFDFALKACAMGPVGLPRGEAGVPECLSAANCPYYRLSVSRLPTAHPPSFVSSARHLSLSILTSVWLLGCFQTGAAFFCLMIVACHIVQCDPNEILGKSLSRLCFSASLVSIDCVCWWSVTSCSDILFDIRAVMVHVFVSNIWSTTQSLKLCSV